MHRKRTKGRNKSYTGNTGALEKMYFIMCMEEGPLLEVPLYVRK